MSSVFPALGASLLAGGTAAAGTAAAGAGAVAATAGASSALTTISSVLSIGSALAAIGQGFAAASKAKAEAAFARTEAVQEEAAGAAKAADLAREYAQLTGEQQVIQLANGLDIGVGTPVSVKESTARTAERNLDVTRKNAANRAAMSRIRARGLMTEARASMLSGFGTALNTGLSAIQLTG